MNYKSKYLKYKRKYLDLKYNDNQLGGNLDMEEFFLNKKLEILTIGGIYHIHLEQKKDENILKGKGAKIIKGKNLQSKELNYVKLLKNENKYLLEFPQKQKNEDSTEEDEKEIKIVMQKIQEEVLKIDDFESTEAEKRTLYIGSGFKNNEDFKNLPLQNKWGIVEDTETEEEKN
jgi:hypothetical protein